MGVKVEELILLAHKYYEDKKVFCYICRKTTFFTYRDSHNNSGVESHCGECSEVWFEWQNRAVQRELEKWIDYNSSKFPLKRYLSLEK